MVEPRDVLLLWPNVICYVRAALGALALGLAFKGPMPMTVTALYAWASETSDSAKCMGNPSENHRKRSKTMQKPGVWALKRPSDRPIDLRRPANPGRLRSRR